jgi:pyruvate kinase
MRKAKIIITLGPASREPDIIEQLIAAGANGVRINMSHGTHEEKTVDIARARAAAAKLNRPIAILVDLSGPKIRTGELKDDQPVRLAPGATFTITTRPVPGDDTQVSTNYKDLPRVVKLGTRLLIDDGALSLIVERATDTDVICKVIDGGMLAERKGINLPGEGHRRSQVGGRAGSRLHCAVVRASSE